MSEQVYEDDPSIKNEDRLFRRVHLAQLVNDDDTGLVRISSGVFKHKELSVNIESSLLNGGSSIETCLCGHQAHKLVFITAGNARRFEQAVSRDPLPNDPSHGLVVGSKNKRSIHDGLRAAAEWVIPPSAPTCEDIETEKHNIRMT
jgi:hypothetical protein